MKIKILALVFALVLTAFTVYAVLDTFVISRVYQAETADTDVFEQRAAAVTSNDASTEGAEAEDILLQEEIAPDENNTDASDESNTDDPVDSSEDDGNSNEWRNRTNNDNNGDSGNSRSSNNNDDDGDSNTWNNDRRSTTDNDDGNSNGWGNDWNTYSNNDDGDSGNWNWEDDDTNDGPTEIDVTEEDALTYKDENIQIAISLYEVNDSTVYVADVQLSSAEYLKSAFARNSYGKNVTDSTSDIAAEHNAIFAINGDYYGARENGYVIRNGVVYREKADDADVLCIYADGSMRIVNPDDVSAQELVDQGVWQAYSFGPALVIDGEIEATSGNNTNTRWRWGWGSTESNNPRTAIGIYEPLHYIFVVSDGRTNASEGLTLDELAEFMQNMGVTTAYNLDGGGSSTMVFQDEVINNPTTYGGRITERNISDIIYIGYE